ncbi:MAG: GAF domain-containing protein, partial [Burkholderiales bacterium]|nr:GAF domain-containing protein [Burkholderiales bacterium]
AEQIRDHIPAWYRMRIPAKALVLFPIMVNRKPVGLLYGDCDRAGDLRFQGDEMSLLKTLRNQAVLAIKARTP